MARLSMTEAAKQWGISRRTLYRRVSLGALSVSSGAGRLKTVDTVEMLRVFGEPAAVTAPVTAPAVSIHENPAKDELIRHLKGEVEHLRKQVVALTEQIAKRDSFEQKLLEFEPKKRRIWQRKKK